MGAAPAFVNASTPQTGGSQNMAVNMPAPIVAGNLLVVLLKQAQQSTACTAQAGWTAATGLNSSNHISVWWRWATGTEDPSYTFSAPALQAIQDGVCIQISGAMGAGQPFDIVTTGRDIAGSVNTVSLSMDTTKANTLLVYADAKNAASRTLSSPPSGMTDRTGPTTSFHVFTQAQAAVGSTGAKQAVMTVTSLHFDVLVAVSPKAEGTFTGAYDFSGSGFTGAAGPGEGTFSGGYDFSGTFTGSAPAPPPVTGNRWTPGGRDRFTARRTPKNRRRSR